MNSDNVDRQWQYLRGKLKAWWDQLTDADLEQVAGKKAQLVALLQDRFGYTRERAQQEVGYGWWHRPPGATAQGTRAGTSVDLGDSAPVEERLEEAASGSSAL
jgi:uncharacterized protein YjbJ (UPF0337 family)